MRMRSFWLLCPVLCLALVIPGCGGGGGGSGGGVITLKIQSIQVQTQPQGPESPFGTTQGGDIVIISGTGFVNGLTFDMVFGIGYDDDIAKAQSVLEEIFANHPKVLKDPEPVVKLNELADSSVNFVCRPWSATSDYWDVYWDVQRALKEKFDAAGISIPYPQQDVHMHQVS